MSSSNDLPTELDLPLQRIIEKESLNNYEIDSRRIFIDGGNYLGSIYEINVSGETKDGNCKKLDLFAKLIIDGTQLKQVSVPELYLAELFVYKDLFKIFAEMQEEVNVPLDERYQTAQFYEESNSELIIMENLTIRGFTTHLKTDGTSFEFFAGAVKKLAWFHGLSFVLKEKKPEYFKEKIKSLRYPYFFNETWRNAVTGVRDNSLNYVAEKYKDKIVQLYEKSMYKYGEYCMDDTTDVCLCHGDYKTNNIMVKTEKSELQEIIIIDYQMVHYGCPLFDFFFFIFTCTDRKFRQAHLTDLKELYYETLRTTLKYFDLDVELVYSREEFEKVYKEKLDFGLMSGLIFMPLILAAQKNLPDFHQSKLKFTCDDIIKERLSDLIEDFEEWGYI